MAKKILNPLLPYENKWVALTKDGKSVVASAASVDALVKKLKQPKKDSVILTRVFPFDKAYSP